jgi:hypothetical protein
MTLAHTHDMPADDAGMNAAHTHDMPADDAGMSAENSNATVELTVSLIAQTEENELAQLEAALLERKQKLGLLPPKFQLRYKAMRKAQVRCGFEPTSPKAGALEEGDVIDALEHRVNEFGVVRVRCPQGWVSVQASDRKRPCEFYAFRAVDCPCRCLLRNVSCAAHVEVLRPLATSFARPLACNLWHHSAHSDGNAREVWLRRAWE